MTISTQTIESIEAQARQDARDAAAGHLVHNPHASTHEFHGIWQAAFEAELQRMGVA